LPSPQARAKLLGEVALYAEFDFPGTVIANNIVDTAAMGISVTNFNEGGRLAVLQGNLILFRRDAMRVASASPWKPTAS
jgi:putative cofactor-binding repeat protein